MYLKYLTYTASITVSYHLLYELQDVLRLEQALLKLKIFTSFSGLFFLVILSTLSLLNLLWHDLCHNTLLLTRSDVVVSSPKLRATGNALYVLQYLWRSYIRFPLPFRDISKTHWSSSDKCNTYSNPFLSLGCLKEKILEYFPQIQEQSDGKNKVLVFVQGMQQMLKQV